VKEKRLQWPILDGKKLKRKKGERLVQLVIVVELEGEP